MKIGFFVTEVGIPKGSEGNVSAHVQIPLHSMKLLSDAGHSVELITTQIAPGERLPSCMPSGIPVHEVLEARRRQAGQSRVRPIRLIAKLRQLSKIVARQRYDVIHFHGSFRLADFAALARLTGVKTATVVTVNDSEIPSRFWSIRRRFWKRISAFITSTEFIQAVLHSYGVHAEVIRHGPVRDLKAELTAPVAQKPHRVLYWRDASMANGADICLAAFRELAPKFPDISFDAAVRNDHWEHWAFKLKELANQHPNIHVHLFPYVDGIGIAELLRQSICVLLPFRALSYHPQLSVLESIQYGVPVITSPLGSNLELADAGRNAVLVPVGDLGATVAAIEKLLKDSDRANAFAQNAAQKSRAVWNWDSYVSQITLTYATAVGQRA